MTYVTVTLTGYANLFRRRYRGRTLFDCARHPHLDLIAADGFWGHVRLGSSLEAAYVRLFSRDASFPGEAHLRSLGGPAEHARGTKFVLSFLTVSGGKVVSYRVGLSSAETAALADSLRDAGDGEVFLDPRDGFCVACFNEPILIAPTVFPSRLAEQRIERFLPRDSQYAPVRRFASRARHILEAHPVNRVREDLGEPVANAVWLWGASRPCEPATVWGPEHGMPVVCADNPRVANCAFFLGFASGLWPDCVEADNLFLWIQSSLRQDADRVLLVRQMERLDSEVFAVLDSARKRRDCRILVTFDSYGDADSDTPHAWAVFLLSGASRPTVRSWRLLRSPSAVMTHFLSGGQPARFHPAERQGTEG